MKNFFPGLLLVICIGLVSKIIARYIPIGSVATAILLGIVLGNCFKWSPRFQGGVALAEKKLLAVAITFMGAQLDVSVLKSLGVKSAGLIVLIVATAVILGYFVGRALKLSTPFALLLGIGNGICGSSAIAAAAPLLNSREEEMGLSISVVNFLGTLGIFLVPLLGGLILRDFSVKNGMLIGGTLQAVGQVTAAGFAVNAEVGNIATIVKMGRILMLGPVLLVLSLIFRKEPTNESKRVFPIPGFIIGFALLALAVNVHVIPQNWLPVIKKISKELLILAMAGVGLKITFSSIVRQGPRALLSGVVVFIVQIGLGLGFIVLFY